MAIKLIAGECDMRQPCDVGETSAYVRFLIGRF